MSSEEELLRLATQREEDFESALNALDLEPPHLLLRWMRAYLADQHDRARITDPVEKLIQLNKQNRGIEELHCPTIKFASGSNLGFKIRMKKQQTGWRIIQFRFHLQLPIERTVDMIRIHLNVEAARELLLVPRCHLHIGGGKR